MRYTYIVMVKNVGLGCVNSPSRPGCWIIQPMACLFYHPCNVRSVPLLGSAGTLNTRRNAKARMQRRRRAVRVDEVCRYLFPMLFILFNAWYWYYYRYTESLKKGCPGLRELSKILPWLADWLCVGRLLCQPHEAAKCQNETHLRDK